MAERRPINGSGSCARCRESLGLASVKRGETWYCSTACAEGRDAVARTSEVPEDWLYARPYRFFGARVPKELNAGHVQSASRKSK